jgi:acetyl esterase/lipase
MNRSHVPLVALAFLMLTAASPVSSWAQAATPVATPTMEPQPPTQPITGPGGSEARFGGMTSIENKLPDQVGADYWLFVPADPLPGTTDAGEPFPLVIFIHGSGALDAAAYLAWIEHLVQRGAVVLYPMYSNTGCGEAECVQVVQDDVRGGLEALAREGVPVDLTRVAVVGHSLGGGLAVDYAASAATAGLPVPTAVMSLVPSCVTAEVACLGADPRAIPATTRVLLVTESDDLDPDGQRAVEVIWAGLEGVPRENRDVVRLVTDGHGSPSLLATHRQALADHDYNSPDALDWYGTWKWFDALMGCAFDGEWCEVALGNTAEQRFMGTWSDGVPVTEAIVIDDPA